MGPTRSAEERRQQPAKRARRRGQRRGSRIGNLEEMEVGQGRLAARNTVEFIGSHCFVLDGS